MCITVFGATGGRGAAGATGPHLVRQAPEAGRHVTAEVMDPEAITKATAGQDAVVRAPGPVVRPDLARPDLARTGLVPAVLAAPTGPAAVRRAPSPGCRR
ncbi:hypothetical protein ACVW0K_003366 [Streptomyces filamentosus]